MQHKVTFPSDGLTLAGVVHVPDDLAEGERRPAIMVLHGFGGSKDGPTHVGEASLYESFITPFTIMLVLPLAACGAFFAGDGCGGHQGLR